ncbi:ATP-NAD kinase-like domain-containing protein [Lineolata rhizophorae]|uniref:ATP-NAD kinase-like domain-containing protein n=1 Tax=Lineolata rhizophorae TaxID=578093 RepID=A0A6A6PEF7_9PEZI|nr:ATP-NAD kinase-like domain-containing protein [Lineolata rhizophorae]
MDVGIHPLLSPREESSLPSLSSISAQQPQPSPAGGNTVPEFLVSPSDHPAASAADSLSAPKLRGSPSTAAGVSPPALQRGSDIPADLDTVKSAPTTPLPFPGAQDDTPATDSSVGEQLPAPGFGQPLRGNKSFLNHRRNKHKQAASIDSIPRQTIMKALAQRSGAPNLMVPDSINSMLAAKEEDARQSEPITSKRLSAALSELQLNSNGSSSKFAAALASPCFFHKRFDDAVNIEKVLEEIQEDEDMSHSRLMQTATSVREVSKQLQRRPIRRAVRNIMIVTKARDNQLVVLTRELAEWLLTTPRYGSDVGVNVYVDAKLRKSPRFDAKGLLAKDPRFEQMLRYWTPDLCWTSPDKFDLVLTLGGDGTVLFTSWLFQRIVPPILSFSLGSLGFLTNFGFHQYKEQLSCIMGDTGMRVNLRMRFTCTVYRSAPTEADPNAAIEAEQFEVLNELVIDRGPSPYVSNLELYGDNALLTVVQADGCIFSTPTGSTAYSLSAGGSLVHPDIPALLLTPICPHTLSFRPMLLPDTMLLRVAVPRASRATAYCAFDGKGRVELRQGDYVTIAASQYPFPSVLSRPTEWFDSLGRTLRWNTRGAQQKAWDGESSAATAAGAPEQDAKFDIDFGDDDAGADSGVSAGNSSDGGNNSPVKRGLSVIGLA